jgi:hypothetical protein
MSLCQRPSTALGTSGCLFRAYSESAFIVPCVTFVEPLTSSRGRARGRRVPRDRNEPRS